MQATSFVLERGSAVGIGLAGFSTALAQPDQLAALRKNPGLLLDKPLAPGFLKNSDDQTVVALAAIGRAMAAMRRPTASFQDWGVVAAPTLFGRLGTVQSLLNFRKEGAWGISPHMIPHQSLHAVSGTISQALQIHGPNFGIGGGPKAVAEAFLVAATMISEGNLSGLWVVLSGHDPECLPRAANVDQPAPAACLAVALALESPHNANSPFYLHISSADAPAHWPEFTLADFRATLETMAPAGRWKLPGCGWVLLENARAEDVS